MYLNLINMHFSSSSSEIDQTLIEIIYIYNFFWHPKQESWSKFYSRIKIRSILKILGRICHPLRFQSEQSGNIFLYNFFEFINLNRSNWTSELFWNVIAWRNPQWNINIENSAPHKLFRKCKTYSRIFLTYSGISSLSLFSKMV